MAAAVRSDAAVVGVALEASPAAIPLEAFPAVASQVVTAVAEAADKSQG